MTTKPAVAVCKFCRVAFQPRSGGGSKQGFCCPNHRKLFHAYGGRSTAKLAQRIIREVLAAVRAELPALVSEAVTKTYAVNPAPRPAPRRYNETERGLKGIGRAGGSRMEPEGA